MYPNDFIQTIVKAIQDIAEENAKLKRRVAELESLALDKFADKLPSFPVDGTPEQQATWFEMWGKLFEVVRGKILQTHK